MKSCFLKNVSELSLCFKHEENMVRYGNLITRENKIIFLTLLTDIYHFCKAKTHLIYFYNNIIRYVSFFISSECVLI